MNDNSLLKLGPLYVHMSVRGSGGSVTEADGTSVAVPGFSCCSIMVNDYKLVEERIVLAMLLHSH